MKWRASKSGRNTYPITSFGRKPIRVEKADKDYYVQLLKSQPQPILALPEERREALIRGVMAEAKARGYHADLDQDLVEETVYFTEHPVAVGGDFDLKFLTLPKELITTVFKTQLKMFPVVDGRNDIQPYFIAVRDGVSANQTEVREGFKKVMSARLSDAVFFYENDKKESLDHFKNKLAERTFVEGLGTMLDKSRPHAGAWPCGCATAWARRTLKTASPTPPDTPMRIWPAAWCMSSPSCRAIWAAATPSWKATPEEGRAMAQFYWPLSSNSELPETLTGALVSLAAQGGHAGRATF